MQKYEFSVSRSTVWGGLNTFCVLLVVPFSCLWVWDLSILMPSFSLWKLHIDVLLFKRKKCIFVEFCILCMVFIQNGGQYSRNFGNVWLKDWGYRIYEWTERENACVWISDNGWGGCIVFVSTPFLLETGSDDWIGHDKQTYIKER